MFINRKLTGIIAVLMLSTCFVPWFGTQTIVTAQAEAAGVSEKSEVGIKEGKEGDKDVSKEPALTVEAKGAVLMDAASGEILFEQNAHERLPLASVTKVMTMLLILEAVERGQLSLSDQVTVSERASGMGGSQMYLEAGEIQPLELLMEGVAICSANGEHS